MLTVRHETIHGQTIVFQAATVIKSAALPVPLDYHGVIEPVSDGYVEFYDKDHNKAFEPARWGTIYVMNDAGKTVAVHALGGWAAPS